MVAPGIRTRRDDKLIRWADGKNSFIPRELSIYLGVGTGGKGQPKFRPSSGSLEDKGHTWVIQSEHPQPAFFLEFTRTDPGNLLRALDGRKQVFDILRLRQVANGKDHP